MTGNFSRFLKSVYEFDSEYWILIIIMLQFLLKLINLRLQYCVRLSEFIDLRDGDRWEAIVGMV